MKTAYVSFGIKIEHKNQKTTRKGQKSPLISFIKPDQYKKSNIEFYNLNFFCDTWASNAPCSIIVFYMIYGFLLLPKQALTKDCLIYWKWICIFFRKWNLYQIWPIFLGASVALAVGQFQNNKSNVSNDTP